MSSLPDRLMGFSVTKSFRSKKISILIELLSALPGILVQLGGFLVGAYLVISGKGATAETVLVFVQLLNYILQPISTIPGYLAGCRSARSLIQKLANALDENVQDTGTNEKTQLQNVLTIAIYPLDMSRRNRFSRISAVTLMLERSTSS